MHHRPSDTRLPSTPCSPTHAPCAPAHVLPTSCASTRSGRMSVVPEDVPIHGQARTGVLVRATGDERCLIFDAVPRRVKYAAIRTLVIPPLCDRISKLMCHFVSIQPQIRFLQYFDILTVVDASCDRCANAIVCAGMPFPRHNRIVILLYQHRPSSFVYQTVSRCNEALDRLCLFLTPCANLISLFCDNADTLPVSSVPDGADRKIQSLHRQWLTSARCIAMPLVACENTIWIWLAISQACKGSGWPLSGSSRSASTGVAHDSLEAIWGCYGWVAAETLSDVSLVCDCCGKNTSKQVLSPKPH